MSLTNFHLSSNSCVNIKGAELEVILSSSHNDIFDKGTNKKDNFTGYLQPVVFPCEQDICHTNTQVGPTNTTTRLSNPITPQCFLNQAPISSTSLVTRAQSDNSNIDSILPSSIENEDSITISNPYLNVPPASPIQFSTTPPTGEHVKRPIRYQEKSSVTSTIPRQTHTTKRSLYNHLMRNQCTIVDMNEAFDGPCKEIRYYKISSRKTYRSSRAHHIQRPCLDFEKMRKMKTRAIADWRQGRELSM